MGIWEFTAETVKRNSPDATPLKNAWISSYSYGYAAFTKIDQAVRIDTINRLGQWMPDDETRSKIGVYTAKFAKNAGLYAMQESYKLIPGGVAFSKIVSKTLNDVRYENLKEEKLKGLEELEKIRRQQKWSSGGRKLIEAAEMHGGIGVKSVSDKEVCPVMSYTERTPEDVIRVFMMKEFFGTRFFDDLLVSRVARGKGKKPE